MAYKLAVFEILRDFFVISICIFTIPTYRVDQLYHVSLLQWMALVNSGVLRHGLMNLWKMERLRKCVICLWKLLCCCDVR